jgi:hypothetical protein
MPRARRSAARAAARSKRGRRPAPRRPPGSRHGMRAARCAAAQGTRRRAPTPATVGGWAGPVAARPRRRGGRRHKGEAGPGGAALLPWKCARRWQMARRQEGTQPVAFLRRRIAQATPPSTHAPTHTHTHTHTHTEPTPPPAPAHLELPRLRCQLPGGADAARVAARRQLTKCYRPAARVGRHHAQRAQQCVACCALRDQLSQQLRPQLGILQGFVGCAAKLLDEPQAVLGAAGRQQLPARGRSARAQRARGVGRHRRVSGLLLRRLAVAACAGAGGRG